MSYSAFLPYASATACGLLAVIAIIRAHRFVDRWAFVAGMLALGLEGLFAGLSTAARAPDVAATWQQWRFLAVSVVPGFWLPFSWSYSRGDAKKRFSAQLGPWLALVAIPPAGVAWFWDSLLTVWHRAPGSSDHVFQLGWAALLLEAILLVASVGVLMNLEATFRASVGTMRWRIKYMLLGVGVMTVARLYTSSHALLFRGIDPSMESVNSAAALVGCLLIVRAMFRTGHFELQVYPSQSVLQGSLAALLAGIYLLIVGVLAKVVTYLGGDASFAFKTFVILLSFVLLALLLQSDRLRLGIRRLVSRHFSRPLYDYRTVWRKFTEGTATRMEQPDLCKALARLVADVFEALSVTVWLVDEGRGRVVIGASTSQADIDKFDHDLPETRLTDVIHHFREHPEPAEFDSGQEAWAVTLRALHPSEFRKGGGRVCIPIISRGELLGLITLGDRVGGVAFSLQDFDMFKCVAEHAAASLLNLHLSQKLLQAKELESFQKMAAFFVHDLKNAASTLNLMLKNLPVHFDNPAFREDALRGIAKTVTRINDLTGRLNTIRHEMKINRTEVDLNELISQTVTAVPLGSDVTVVQNLGTLPKVRVDRDQIGKVILNLLLNAGEAMTGRGRLEIGTTQAGAWAVLTVADTGCGMSPDFLNRSLFHPFQTTKKNGLGIGMFQCKAIVDAHAGKITVVSEAGKGSIFSVFLPIQK